MGTLTHALARQYLQAEADGLLGDNEARQLNEHLRECPECRAYGADLHALADALPRAWRARWGANPNTSPALLPNVLRAWGARAATRNRGLIFGFNRIGLVAGLLAMLAVTGAAAAAVQNQPGGFSSLLNPAAESSETPTNTPTGTLEASATACHEDGFEQSSELTATATLDACVTGSPEPNETECEHDCGAPTLEATHEVTETEQVEASRTPEPSEVQATEPPEASHTPEASRTPEPTEIHPTEPPEPTEVHPPEASRTPEPTEVHPTEPPEPTEVHPTEPPEPTEVQKPTEVHPTEPPEATEVHPTQPPEPTEVHPTEVHEPTEVHPTEAGHTPEPTQTHDGGGGGGGGDH